jgi:nitroreductase
MNTLLELDHAAIKDAIVISQHTQRNWDLTRSISQEDMDLLIHAATQCPSKQNIAYYKTHFITNRELIEKIHAKTEFKSRSAKHPIMTNTQVLANLLIVFEKVDFIPTLATDIPRSNETDAIIAGTQTEEDMECLRRDAEMAVGIAAGYLNLTASMLGLRTGCCACFDPPGVQEILGMENEPILLMGIGYKNAKIGRRIHHLMNDFVFATKMKQPIAVQMHK